MVTSLENLVINGAEIHTSCSQDILGVTFAGGITVTGYVDSEGSVSDIETCPVAPVAMSSAMVGFCFKMSVVYHGPNNATITVGADAGGNNSSTFSNVQNDQILTAELGDVGNWWYWSVNGAVDARIFTPVVLMIY